MFKSLICFLAVCISVYLVFKLYVLPTWILVENPGLFIAITASLVFLSFASSANEAAISRASSDPSVSTYFEQQKQRLTELAQKRIASLKENGSGPFIFTTDRELRKLTKKRKKLEKIEVSLTGEERDNSIGALAAFSVFANLAIAVLLPLSIVSHVLQQHQSLVVLELSTPNEAIWTAGAFPTIQWTRGTWDLTSPKALVFFASTIPVLFLGKIIPKLLGAYFVKFFSIHMFRFSSIVTFCFGWISKGTRFPLTIILR